MRVITLFQSARVYLFTAQGDKIPRSSAKVAQRAAEMRVLPRAISSDDVHEIREEIFDLIQHDVC